MKHLALLFGTFFAVAGFGLIATQASAATLPFLAPSIGKVGTTPKVSATKGVPSVSLSYTLKPRQFTVVAKNLKTVQYTIEYVRAGNITEGLTGGGKTKSGTFVGRHFAGTQSSKYFIPHDVRSGKIILTGKTMQDKDYSYTKSFTVKSGKLVFTK